MVIRMVQSLI